MEAIQEKIVQTLKPKELTVTQAMLDEILLEIQSLKKVFLKNYLFFFKKESLFDFN